MVIISWYLTITISIMVCERNNIFYSHCIRLDRRGDLNSVFTSEPIAKPAEDF